MDEQGATGAATTDDGTAAGIVDADELRDELPDDLNPAGFVGAYQFPDNSRRRIQGAIYLAAAAVTIGVYLTLDASSAVVNGGFLASGILLAVVAVFCFSSGWKMHIDEKEALVAAQQSVGFAVGHAAAQQVWHGVRSRPTWRVLCYSAEEPPQRRGLVLIDAVDGHTVQQLVQDNLDDWDA